MTRAERKISASSSAVVAPYEPTPREKKAGKAWLARREEKTSAPRMKVANNKTSTEIAPDHLDPTLGQILLMEAIGTSEPDFLNGFISQLANVGSQGSVVEERGLNFMLAIVKGISPKDEIEAMLAAQMAAVHNATMTFARRLNHVENIPQQDSVERAFNKLARTFAAQVEALKRYRTGGEQRVTVQHQHVNVGNGGQAIVGQVAHAPAERGVDEKTGGQPHALTDARGSQVLCEVEEERETVPRSGSER